MNKRHSHHRGQGEPSPRGFNAHRRGPARFRSFKNRGRSKPAHAERINHERFINKAVITEEAEHFVPEHAFNDFKIEDALKHSIAAKGYRVPTPIQDRSIPHILSGIDVVGIANTGTGKTGAFLIPLINKILNNRRERVLVVVPTRELALQIEQEFKEFSRGMRMFSVCCVGGASLGRQISQLRYEYNIIVGTPGRLKDLINRNMIRLAEFNTIVLDEADRMLDMGFVEDMRFLVSRMPTARQTLFFSATLSPHIEKLIKDFCREPVRISVKTGDTAKTIEQDVVRVAGTGPAKIDMLHDLLVKKDFSKVLVFARTKHGAEKLGRELVARGFTAESIHGDKSHAQRQRALAAFKNNRAQVLVATDVAARGLDIADISHVINFDIPATYDDYVHRIGRTGRGNKRGKALTFIE